MQKRVSLSRSTLLGRRRVSLALSIVVYLPVVFLSAGFLCVCAGCQCSFLTAHSPNAMVRLAVLTAGAPTPHSRHTLWVLPLTDAASAAALCAIHAVAQLAEQIIGVVLETLTEIRQINVVMHFRSHSKESTTACIPAIVFDFKLTRVYSTDSFSRDSDSTLSHMTIQVTQLWPN